ncbi:MAG TPA: hypothetical protein DCS07_05730 [Bdellovibrionales bacterium]|nr:MAG: hypothetical protein A2X97_10240 [Bdellovibrionales bacterium GWA1_52_35]HAR42119.1 hypothetical protein [Bdellovibrionales bacterium]HCM38708.1 hypothetical protein [Bdellovibrionales bacterium]
MGPEAFQKKTQIQTHFFLEPFFNDDGDFLDREAPGLMTQYLFNRYYREFYKAGFCRFVGLQFYSALEDDKLLRETFHTFWSENKNSTDYKETTTVLFNQELTKISNFIETLSARFPECFQQ